MTTPAPRPAPAAMMTFERSRCCVMRFKRSSCRRCVNVCSQEAIAFAPGFSFSPERCTGCLRCAAVCPSGAFGVACLESEQLCEVLSKVSNPVLGCRTRLESQGHVKVPCLGGLDEEWLLVLLLVLPDTVQLNLAACGTCHNRAIVADVEHSLKNIAVHTGIDTSHTIRLVENRSELVYKAQRFDRRRFFRAFGTKVIRDIQRGIPSQLLRYGNTAYNQKVLPFKRQHLNQLVKDTSIVVRKNILTHYYYTVECSEPCDASCSACVAICPTGALQRGTADQQLRFNPSLCVGCAVCVEFCSKNVIQLQKGWFRDQLTTILL